MPRREAARGQAAPRGLELTLTGLLPGGHFPSACEAAFSCTSACARSRGEGDALLACFSLADLRPVLPFVLSVSAASLIYVAAADLIPSLHQRGAGLAGCGSSAPVLGGVATIALLRSAAEQRLLASGPGARVG
jgi:hypothetical protein